ncbi:MAG: bifunctional diaminohydroxyphosphoribosylaminopyrimidine deaminase/5-amino-6-(5-phosphoribosylamino)uracil reductase RibD [Rhizobiales bacterium]|nr:bifunctional diaminohydroxyphosphoribosylaminopyrimidine deaminase/5-amino-6-(5-phosphoribosylamino)uracil reductase RibD [Hyphomicrobiales bacterium]
MNDPVTPEPAASAAPATAAATSADDARFMALAFTLGRRNLGHTWPNPAVGSVIVKDGIILARGWTQAGGRPHAEMEALRRAKKVPQGLQGATMYVTLEPCSHQGKTPPCADAIIKAGIARVVSALEDPNPEVAGKGHEKLRTKGIAVDVGLGADEARRVHVGHITRMQKARPFVTLKLALSADGKVGLAGRKPVAISGEAARTRVFQMRSASDAILVGIGTVRSDNPHLTCRLPGMDERSPVRVVLDANLRLPLATAVVATVRETPTWVFTSRKPSAIAEDILQQKGCQVFRVDDTDGKLDLDAVLKILVEQGITRLMVEGGPTVAASFVGADLVDAAVLLRSEKTIGEDGIDALEGMPLAALTERLQARGSERLGGDTIEHYERT